MNEFKQTNPFKVPEGYFDAKKKSLKELAIEPKTTKIIWFKPLLITLATAACLALFFISLDNSKNKTQEISFGDISEDSLLEYINYNDETDATSLMTELAANTYADNEIETRSNLNIDEENLEAYLLLQQDDVIFEDLF